METIRIDDHIAVYTGGGCNSVVLYSRDSQKAIVVDTKYLRGAKELRKRITAKKITIINTHFHMDHARGNHFYPEAFVISGSTNWRQWDFDSAHSKHPDRVLNPGDVVRIDCDDEIVQVIDLGPAHSPNDLVVYFEKRKVLAAGDLVWPNMHPVLIDRNTNLIQWMEYLERIDANYDVNVVVPGHGDVVRKSAISDMTTYFSSIFEATGDQSQLKNLKQRYKMYKGFPIFGSFGRTVRFMARERLRAR